LNKADFKLTLIKRDKEGHSIQIKGKIHQNEITIINLYAPNVNVPNFIKHALKDLKTYANSSRVTVEDCNTPLSLIERSSKQRINKEILELNHTIDQMDLTSAYRIFHSTDAKYTFFLAAHGNISKIDHIFGHEASLSKYKKTKIIPCILSDHKALKLEINNKNSSKKHANNLKLNNTLLNEIKEEIKSFLEVHENENRTYQNLWDTAKAVLRGKFIAISVYIERSETFHINDLRVQFKLLENQEQANPKASRRSEIIKIKAEINEIEIKNNIERINETKGCSLEQ
jgi:hypothetical protein